MKKFTFFEVICRATGSQLLNGNETFIFALFLLSWHACLCRFIRKINYNRFNKKRRAEMHYKTQPLDHDCFLPF